MTTDPQEYPYALDIAAMFIAVQTGPIAPYAIAGAITLAVARRSGLFIGIVLDLVAQLTGSAEIPDTPVIRKLLPGLERLPNEKAQRILTAPSAIVPPPADTPQGQQQRTISIDQVAQDDNILVVGPKGSGKTTLLTSLIRIRRGSHIALDPHNTPGKWPCSTVGGGLVYGDIARVLSSAYSTMRNRYQAMAQGTITEQQCRAKPYTLVGDEYRSITRAIPGTKGNLGASDVLLDLLTQGRKAGMFTLIAAHADTVKALGIEGEGDLRTSFDWIVYLGALAVRKVPAAAQMTRPAVAYHSERDEYYLVRVERVKCSVPSVQPSVASSDADTTLERLLNVQPSDERSDNHSGRSYAVQGRSDVQVNGVNDAEPAHQPPDERTNDTGMPTGDELRKLMKALTIYQDTRSKQRAIEQAFGCKKGGSQSWKRASMLFDLALSEAESAPVQDDDTDGPEPDVGPFGKYL